MRVARTLAALMLCLGACSDAVDNEGAGPVSAEGDAARAGGAEPSGQGDAGSDKAPEVVGDAGESEEAEVADVSEAAGDVPLSDSASPDAPGAPDASGPELPLDVVTTEDAEGLDAALPGGDTSALLDAGAGEGDVVMSDSLDPDDDAQGGAADVDASAGPDAPDTSGTSTDVLDDAGGLTDAGMGDVGPVTEVQDSEGAVEEVMDTGSEDAAPSEDVEVAPKPLYLLSVNNSQKTLEKIDIETGAGIDVCQLPPTSNYPSLTFSRDNILFGSRQGQYLDAIDPCTCEVTSVGSYNGFTGVNGITSDFGLNLFGVSHIQDVLITINSQSGAGTSVGPLGVNFGYTGATWSDEEQVIYAIDASSDGLFKISPESGEATFVAPLSLPMGTVGIEMHPDNGVLYACSDAAHLLSVDLITGEVTDIGDMGQNTACNNLAAPWKEVPCLDEL